jgi:hypothetical protein
MQTVRSKLIHHGASIKFVGKICPLRLNSSYRYQTEVEGIYDGLKQEVQVMKVAEHKALYKYRK